MRSTLASMLKTRSYLALLDILVTTIRFRGSRLVETVWSQLARLVQAESHLLRLHHGAQSVIPAKWEENVASARSWRQNACKTGPRVQGLINTDL